MKAEGGDRVEVVADPRGAERRPELVEDGRVRRKHDALGPVVEAVADDSTPGALVARRLDELARARVGEARARDLDQSLLLRLVDEVLREEEARSVLDDLSHSAAPQELAAHLARDRRALRVVPPVVNRALDLLPADRADPHVDVLHAAVLACAASSPRPHARAVRVVQVHLALGRQATAAPAEAEGSRRSRHVSRLST